MARTKYPKHGAQDVFRTLAKRFDSPAWALFSEVGNATGFGCSRHADAIAMSLWPSRGLTIHGVEIKVSRSDWLSELRQPEKADAIYRYCDHWWVAVGNPDIVQAGELPATWGLLVMSGEKLVAKVDAPKLEPVALDRGFVAALLRRADEGMRARERTARAEGIKEGQGKPPEEYARQIKALERSAEHFQNAIAEFEAKSGVKIDTWNAGRIGSAVKKVLAAVGGFDDDDPVAELESVRGFLEHKIKIFDNQIQAMKSAKRIATKALAEGEAAE